MDRTVSTARAAACSNRGVHDSPAVQYSSLGDGRPVDEDELYRLYAYPASLPGAPSRCVVRGNVIASLDGAAKVDLARAD